jgi:sulfur relay (sulfurtransferase) DsrC/TusE family protein
MTDTADKPDAAKLAAFFDKIPDPPQNTLVALEEAHAADAEGEADEPSPKGETPSKKESKPTSTSTSKNSDSAAADAPLADRVVAALKAGDLDLLADLTDQDPEAFDEKSTKWAARNRKESKLKAEIEKVRTDAASVIEHWEPVDERATRFHATKDYALVKELVEILTGEDWDSVAAKTFRALRTTDPRVPELAKAVAKKDAELAEHRTSADKAADRALREALRDDLPEDHQVRKLPEWEEKVAKVLRESVDEYTGDPALSFKQAAQRVVRTAREAYQKYQGVFAEEPRPTRQRAETPERARGSAPSTKRPLTREEFFATFK